METTYTYIKKRYEDEAILAIGKDTIKEMPLASVRDSFGQSTGSDNAGDSVTLDTEKAVQVANKLNAHFEEWEEVEETYLLGDYVSAYDNSQLFDAIRSSDELKKDEDYTLNQEVVKGFEYWDGHNWMTIVAEAEHYDSEYEIINDEALITELEKAIEDREFVQEGFGEKVYEANGYMVIDNYCQGSFEAYRLIDSAIYDEQREATGYVD